MADLKVGNVTHYYDKIGVAVAKLNADLGKGDMIRFVRGGEELFEQPVESMQAEHDKLESAKSGDTVGLKTIKPVKEGAEIYKIG